MKKTVVIMSILFLSAVFWFDRSSALSEKAAQQWLTLFSGDSLDGWKAIGDANWRLVDEFVEANHGSGFLVTADSYGDFRLRLEFWVDEAANSGVFIRCSDPANVTGNNCYEVNIFDRRPDPAYRTGGIVNLAQPLVELDSGGKWNTFEISAEGTRLLVKLNGVLTVDVEDSRLPEGPIALQRRAGTVRFRNVQILPLD